MSTCALMLVKDETDIIEHTIRHLAGEVDEILVADNMSSDGTSEILHSLEAEGLIRLSLDDDPAHYQSVKTTKLAVEAVQRGHEWVLPCDSDEYWYQPEGVRISDWLGDLPPELNVARAVLYDHKPTVLDPEEEPNPFARIGWRVILPGALPKVAVKMRAGAVIRDGNHGVIFPVWAPIHYADGLVIRHYSWRTEAQFVHKRRIGYEALNRTKLSTRIGEHWRAFGPDIPDETIANHFRQWFYCYDPERDGSLMYDPINARTNLGIAAYAYGAPHAQGTPTEGSTA